MEAIFGTVPADRYALLFCTNNAGVMDAIQSTLHTAEIGYIHTRDESGRRCVHVLREDLSRAEYVTQFMASV